jgi:cob(I)alamin adenosyltransferase
MKIYTKTGDYGTTFMPGEGRVKKYDYCIESQGEIDELNAWIALIIQNHSQFSEVLENVQDVLMNMGAQLARGDIRLSEKDINYLENLIDDYDSHLKELKNFILPSYPSEVHIARTVCRRAERSMIKWQDSQSEDGVKKFELIVPYLNRLSDYLFNLARFISKNDKVWKGNS